MEEPVSSRWEEVMNPKGPLIYLPDVAQRQEDSRRCTYPPGKSGLCCPLFALGFLTLPGPTYSQTDESHS